MEKQFSEPDRPAQAEIDKIVERHMSMLSRSLDSDAGYRGLYGGLTKSEIHARKQLAAGEEITNWMSPEELAANIFRVSQARARLRREQFQNQEHIDQVHFQVGQLVRQVIAEIGGSMPENMPTPEQSARQSLQEELAWLKQGDEFHLDKDE